MNTLPVDPASEEDGWNREAPPPARNTSPYMPPGVDPRNEWSLRNPKWPFFTDSTEHDGRSAAETAEATARVLTLAGSAAVMATTHAGNNMRVPNDRETSLIFPLLVP
jgi:hypothetical protein